MNYKPLLIMAALGAIFVLEGIFPHFLGRKQRISHAAPHVLTALFNGFLTSLLLAVMTLPVILWTESHSLGVLHTISLPAAASAVIAFLLFDLWMYLWHMANHRLSFFWLFHRAHHADIAMDTTTALRFHPGELILSTIIRLPVIALIGMSFSHLALYEVILNISTLFHHSNLGVPEKWDRLLRIFIVTPNMHRVHHSIERLETNSNFTATISVWDRLYNTFRQRPDTKAITLGLPRFREQKWQGLWGFLITPFSRAD